MRIKRIEVIGFKSFCDRTVLRIDEPITAVVGPNGCGKSNIVDAIRWCMGEQSAKHLRGKAMEDVIFGGSETRGPAAMAEVSLTFEDVGFVHHEPGPDAEVDVDGLDEGTAIAGPNAKGGSEPALGLVPGTDAAAQPAGDGGPAAPETQAEAMDRATAETRMTVEAPATREPQAQAGEPATGEAQAAGEPATGEAQAAGESAAAAAQAASDPATAEAQAASEPATAEAQAAGEPTTDSEDVDGEAGDPAPTASPAADAAPAVPGPASVEVAAILGDAPPVIDFSRYGEVTVTRRLFRDGSSDYFINKTPCRLRDVTDFFLGTGVGTKAYSIIEQGRIGMIVSAKPEDRRLIIEEAAGITKFKKKKQAAERKMDQTRQNLLRVSDIVGEIEKQLGSLRRQAQKAERYKRYRAEMKDIELWSASHRWLGCAAETKFVASTLEGVVAARDAAQTAHQTNEAKLAAERAARAVEERRLTELTQTVYDLENRLQLGDNQVEFQGREARELEDRGAAARGEIEGLTRQLEQTRAELEAARADVARLDAEAASRGAELAGLESAQTAARESLTVAQGDLDDARGEVGRAQADIARGEGNIRALERRQDDLERRRERVVEEEGRLGSRETETATALGDLDQRLGTLRQLTTDLGNRRAAHERRLAELKEQHNKLEAEVETLRTEHHRRRSRLQSLREIQDRYEGFARGTRAVMKHRPGDDAERHRIRGLLADFLEAPPKCEAAVEAVLGERLGSVLVESREVGVEAIQFLKQRAEGRSTFIPVSAGADDAGGRSAIEVVDADGVVGTMVQMVRCPDEYRSVADYLFQDAVVVESLDRALQLYEAGLHRTLVTLDGDIVDRYGAVTGGSRDKGAGVLAQKREIRELEEITAGLEQDLADAQARLVNCKAELQQTGTDLDTIRRESHQGEMAMLAQEKDLARFRADAERLAERKAQIERERVEVEAALAELSREQEENGVALTGARVRADDAERRQLGLIEGVTVARGALDDATAAVTECKVRSAQVQAERSAMRVRTGRLEAQVDELGGRITKLEQSIEEGAKRSSGLLETAERLRQELVGVREARRLRTEELTSGRAEHERQLALLETAELELRGMRQEAERLATEARDLELKLHDLDGVRRHVEEAIEERYRLALVREVYAYHLRPSVTEADEARLKELRELIERMGEINLTAIEEFEELSKRHEFLTAQKQDLESALAQLESAIAKINRTSRKLFRDMFDAVNERFQKIFPRLFRGGQAQLRLTGGEQDLLESGVEIFAQPPGKKNTTVELLSGGEKALTAVALVFAVFLCKPSPFCILDEVDAPLDEANVGRYNDMIREMTDRSQFIVITHNKRTMGIADTLYGITMEEPGVSKLVSVNLRQFDFGRQAA